MFCVQLGEHHREEELCSVNIWGPQGTAVFSVHLGSAQVSASFLCFSLFPHLPLYLRFEETRLQPGVG